MEHPTNNVRRWFNREHKVEDYVRTAALIGSAGKERPRPGGMSTLKGEAALAEVDQDLKELLKASKMAPEAFDELAATYRRVVSSLLALDGEAVLANSGHGSYDELSRTELGHRADGFICMSHAVFLPFAPGGFIQVDIDISGRDEDLDLGLGAGIEYFEHDIFGREADQSYNSERNLKAINALKDYVVIAANKTT